MLNLTRKEFGIWLKEDQCQESYNLRKYLEMGVNKQDEKMVLNTIFLFICLNDSRVEPNSLFRRSIEFLATHQIVYYSSTIGRKEHPLYLYIQGGEEVVSSFEQSVKNDLNRGEHSKYLIEDRINHLRNNKNHGVLITVFQDYLTELFRGCNTVQDVIDFILTNVDPDDGRSIFTHDFISHVEKISVRAGHGIGRITLIDHESFLDMMVDELPIDFLTDAECLEYIKHLPEEVGVLGTVEFLTFKTNEEQMKSVIMFELSESTLDSRLYHVITLTKENGKDTRIKQEWKNNIIDVLGPYQKTNPEVEQVFNRLIEQK